ncbi:MAG: hypothetical protein LW814_04420 [Anabaena sp. CoA2_C59]|nr:hypothetical protein [Anabaena sp. CoA2_C59]MDJ0504830.1 hypothetical protein [Nostocales cyanobacterium LE14-WE12]
MRKFNFLIAPPHPQTAIALPYPNSDRTPKIQKRSLSQHRSHSQNPKQRSHPLNPKQRSH